MIKCNLFQQSKEKEEHIDIYYNEMKPTLKKVIDLIGQDEKVLWGKDEEERISIPTGQILYLESVEKRSFAYLKEKVYEVDGTLAELEERLGEYGFIRISKSQIVNVYRIKSLKPEVNMKVSATFANGEKIVINRSYKKAFHEYLMKVRGALHEKEM